MCRHQVSPFRFSSTSSLITHPQYKTIAQTVTLTSPSFSAQIEIHINHVMWSALDLRESKIDHNNAIYPISVDLEACKVQWVGIRYVFFYLCLLQISLNYESTEW